METRTDVVDLFKPQTLKDTALVGRTTGFEIETDGKGLPMSLPMDIRRVLLRAIKRDVANGVLDWHHPITIATSLSLSMLNRLAPVTSNNRYVTSTLRATDRFHGNAIWDCVKLAVDIVLKERKPDLLVSGINHGSNSSINVIYSGTMSAAVEGAIEGIPSIGFSLCDFSHKANFQPGLAFVKQIMASVLKNGLPKGTLLNVNIPKTDLESDIKGIKIARQALARWKENFVEREDPGGRKYFWLTGKFVNDDKGTDTDEWALQNAYVSVVPTQFDLTDHHNISYLNSWSFES
jgi:5'/3'-nucleotidase SurE